MEGIGQMPYTIVFANRDLGALSTADAATAREALAIAEALRSQRGEIKYITSPQEGQFGIEMLRVLAKEEGEEMPASTTGATNQGQRLFGVASSISKAP